MAALPSPARDLSERLSARVLDVCRTYLSNGRRCGRYWTVGDVQNSRGRSMFVRLTGPASGRGAAGHWIDMATGEHGDLVDLLQVNLGLPSLGDALDEARRFLSLPRPEPVRAEPAPRNSSLAAQRLFATGRPVPGTLAERYLRSRRITAPLDCEALRFHPDVWCRERGPKAALPALLTAITDLSGRVTAVQRTWLDPVRADKAQLEEPRRSIGDQLGHGVRLGRPIDVMLAGEGVETVLSIRSALPRMPMVAGLSANHLGALLLPKRLKRLYIARDRDRDGEGAAVRLRASAEPQGCEVFDLVPRAGDFNADLRQCGPADLRRRLMQHLSPEDAERFGQPSSG